MALLAPLSIGLAEIEAGDDVPLLQSTRTIAKLARVSAVVFDRTGTRLFVGGFFLHDAGSDGEIKVWSVKEWRELSHWPLSGDAIRSLSPSPDGKLLAVGGTGAYDAERDYWSGSLVLRDAETGKVTVRLEDRPGDIFAVQFSPDGKTLASAGWDEKIELWDVGTGRKLSTMSGQGQIGSLAFSPDGTILANGSAAQSVQTWDLKTGVGMTRFEARDLGEGVRAVAFSPDGKKLAACCQRGVAVWDVATGQRLRVLRSGIGSPLCMAFSPDGRNIASGNFNGSIALMDVEAGKLTVQMKEHTGPVQSLTFSPIDGSILVSGSDDQTIKVWKLGEAK